MQVVDHQSDGQLCAPAIQPRVEPQHELGLLRLISRESSPSSAMKRNAERIGRNGIDIDVKGRHPPNRTVEDHHDPRTPERRGRSCRRRDRRDPDRLRLAPRSAVEKTADDAELVDSAHHTVLEIA